MERLPGETDGLGVMPGVAVGDTVASGVEAGVGPAVGGCVGVKVGGDTAGDEGGWEGVEGDTGAIVAGGTDTQAETRTAVRTVSAARIMGSLLTSKQ